MRSNVVHRSLGLALMLVVLPAAARAQANRVESSVVAQSVGAGARAFGMGGAFIAVADDATAASWNPAGLAVLEKPEVSIVWKGFDRVSQWSAASTATMRATFPAFTLDQNTRASDSQYRTNSSGIDFLSASVPLHIGGRKLVLQGSYQRTIGLTYETRTVSTRETRVDQTFVGGEGFQLSRTYGAESFRLDNAGGIDTWAASAALEVSSRLYVGAAVNLWRNGDAGSSEYSTMVDERIGGACAGAGCSTRYPYTIVSAFSDEFSGVNANVGILVRPLSRLRVAAVMKTPFTMNVDSAETLTVVNPTPLAAPVVQYQLQRSSASAELTWPRTLGIGASFQPNDNLTVAFDYTTTDWSSATAETTLEVQDLATPGGATTRLTVERPWPGTYDPRQPVGPTNRPQLDSRQLRLGAEYLLVGSRVVVPVRIGGFTDRQFSSTPVGDEIAYLGATVGAGLVWSNYALDVAVTHQRTSAASGYETASTGGFERRTADGDDRYRVTRLYTSLIVRF